MGATTAAAVVWLLLPQLPVDVVDTAGGAGIDDEEEEDGGGGAAGAVDIGFGGAAAGGFPHTLATLRTFNATCSVGVIIVVVAVLVPEVASVLFRTAPGGNGTLDVWGKRVLPPLLLLLPIPLKWDKVTVPGVVGFS